MRASFFTCMVGYDTAAVVPVHAPQAFGTQQSNGWAADSDLHLIAFVGWRMQLLTRRTLVHNMRHERYLAISASFQGRVKCFPRHSNTRHCAQLCGPELLGMRPEFCHLIQHTVQQVSPPSWGAARSQLWKCRDM